MPSFGTLKADTLTHSTAGSLATNFVVEGSAKAFAGNIVEPGETPVDSLNISSTVDAGTGNNDVNFTNAFGNAGYSNVGSDNFYGLCQTEPNSQTTTACNIFTYNNSFATRDNAFSITATGDLA